MGRATKQQAAENRARVVEAAASLFQERGLEVGIAELMAAAGLTHGGFYRQFGSKDRLAGEACTRSLQDAAGRWREARAGAPNAGFRAIVDGYLQGGGQRCAVPALAGEVRREPAGGAVRTAFTAGVADLAAVLEAAAPGPDARPRALAALAALVGAVTLANAVDDPALAADILQAVRSQA